MFLYNLYINNTAKQVIKYSLIPFIIFSYIDYFKNPVEFSNYPLLVEYFTFILFIIYFFYEKMKTVTQYPLYQSISFWICVGLFFSFTGNFFFLLFVTSGMDTAVEKQMKIIYSVVIIAKNILLGVAWFASERKVNPSESDFSIPSELDLDSYTPTNNLN
jgi:hypothetical protein